MHKALVAVSGGSDSLALLHILLTNKEYELIVVHVNYNYRETSKRDEKIVTTFCENNGLKYHVLELDSKKDKVGNFEEWARVKRYKFFKEIYDKYSCQCLFVGHQKEDVIETYYLQKKRNSIVEYYGLMEENILQGMRVVRPLLGYSKKELEQYCHLNHINYGVDETNFDLTYSRNKIRHEVISNMSEKEKDEVINEINNLNLKRKEHVSFVKETKMTCLLKSNVLSIDKLNVLEDRIKKEVIYYFLIDNIYKKISISDGRLEDIIKKISSNRPNIVLACYDDITLYKEYNLLVIEKNKNEYCYEITSDEEKRINEEFVVSHIGKKLERVVVSKDQFPLYLKNYDCDNKVINRLFIDKKIPLRKRKKWPIIVDKFGVLLLVIGIKKFYNETCNINGDLVDFYIHESEENKGE